MSVYTDFLRPESPPPISSYRRASLNVKSLSLDENAGCLSISLPLSMSKDNCEKKEAKKGETLNTKDIVVV